MQTFLCYSLYNAVRLPFTSSPSISRIRTPRLGDVEERVQDHRVAGGLHHCPDAESCAFAHNPVVLHQVTLPPWDVW